MKKLFYSCAIMALMASCSSNDEMSTIGDKFAGEINVTSEAYTFADGTRTSLTNTGSAIEFAWDNDETIGIFPIAPTTNAQAYQKLVNGAGEGTQSSFDGAGWALLRGNTYAAYYPVQNLSTFDTYKAIPIDMTGQTQDGNGSLAHIGESYDYMYAVVNVPAGNGAVSFDFKHVGSIVMLELTMPEAGEWKKVRLTSSSRAFVSSATMNVSTGAITTTSKSEVMSLSLKNIRTAAANENLTLYMAALPTTTGELKVVVTNAEGKEYSATLVSKTLAAGKAYKWTASPKGATINYGEAPDDVEAVDLGLPSGIKWANMNVGATTPEGKGTYFAWGEVTGCEYVNDNECVPAIMDGNPNGWSAGVNSNYVSGRSKTNFGSWTYYKWGNSDSNFYKYVASSSYGTVDRKTTLDPEDDAAHVNWGGDWRMPTHAEQEELYSNCYWVWTSSYNGTGVPGYIVYKALSDSDKGTKVYSGSSAKSGYILSVNHIFLPASGGRLSSSFYDVGSWGYYWSSSLGESSSDYAWSLNFSAGYLSYFTNYRFCGLSVRAVCR